MSSDKSYVIRASDATNAATVNQNGNVVLTGNSDVGLGASSSITKAHVNHDGSTGNLQLEARWRNQSFFNLKTTYGHGYIYSS